MDFILHVKEFLKNFAFYVEIMFPWLIIAAMAYVTLILPFTINYRKIKKYVNGPRKDMLNKKIPECIYETSKNQFSKNFFVSHSPGNVFEKDLGSNVIQLTDF